MADRICPNSTGLAHLSVLVSPVRHSPGPFHETFNPWPLAAPRLPSLQWCTTTFCLKEASIWKLAMLPVAQLFSAVGRADRENCSLQGTKACTAEQLAAPLHHSLSRRVSEGSPGDQLENFVQCHNRRRERNHCPPLPPGQRLYSEDCLQPRNVPTLQISCDVLMSMHMHHLSISHWSRMQSIYSVLACGQHPGLRHWPCQAIVQCSHSRLHKMTIACICSSQRVQGAYRIAQCSSMETTMAPTSHRLAHGGCTSSEPFSEMAFNALNISTTTSTLMATVDGPRASNMEHL